ncbi:MAG: elongation factor P [Actinobacteria bacterium]|nr:MAG: elongation factor P [Actinomycetota bacterium]
MAVTTSNFKNGMCIMYDGKMWIIVEFQHVKPGKGGAFVRTKLKELKTGRVVDITFRAGEKMDDVRVETKRMQYLYNDGSAFHFMDTASYEQIELDADFVGDTAKWLKENDEVELMVADGDFIGVEPPMFVELEITETDPGFKGDTVQGGTKPATLETGAVVQVPMFINAGERVKIDTRDGRYVTRV